MEPITTEIPAYTTLPEWRAYKEAQARYREAQDRYREADHQVFDLGKDELLPALQAAGEAYDKAIVEEHKAFMNYMEASTASKALVAEPELLAAA